MKRKPEMLIDLAAGETEMIEIEITNATHQPNKSGCALSFADYQPCGDNLPLKDHLIVCGDVKGFSDATFEYPLTMHPDTPIDGQIYELHLTFRTRTGKPFGEIIPIRVRCNNETVAYRDP